MAAVESAAKNCYCASDESFESALVCNSPVGNPKDGATAIEIPSRQVTEFKHTFGPFGYYFYRNKLKIEDDPNLDVDEYFREDSDEEEEDTYHVANPRDALIKHVQQVRHSCGFDVDVVVPSWALVYYFPVDLSDPVDRAHVIEGAIVAIDGINQDIKKERYELVEVVKAVYCRNFSMYLTINAKKKLDGGEAAEANNAQLVTIQAIVLEHLCSNCELQYWRFKPLSN